MRCPFKKVTKITRGIKRMHEYTHDKIENFFGECSKENCMAYDKKQKGV